MCCDVMFALLCCGTSVARPSLSRHRAWRPRPQYSSKAQRISLSCRHKDVNVIPRSDLVPMVDGQLGTLLHIDCPLSNPIQCHSVSNTICELLASCGDGGVGCDVLWLCCVDCSRDDHVIRWYVTRGREPICKEIHTQVLLV